MSPADRAHWPSVVRAGAGFLGVMALGWTIALATGWDWVGFLAMVPAAACGYAWANRYERREGVVPRHDEQAVAARFLRLMVIVAAATGVVAAIQRNWTLTAICVAGLGVFVRSGATTPGRR